MKTRATRPPAPLPPLVSVRLGHPGFLVAALVTAAALVVTVTFWIYDYDLWEHLVVGKYIWLHGIPTTQQWTWPLFGQPVLVPSWLFRALLWPFWDQGGVLGLFVWRWITVLAAFGCAFFAARRMGADPLVTLPVLVLAALVLRTRTMVRPETLAAVLLMLQIWLLESRRRGGSKADAGLVAIALVWINVHISFYLGFFNLALHALAAHFGRGGADGVRVLDDKERRDEVSGLVRVGLVALAVSFLNPGGWKAVAQPFEFALFGRFEAIYRTIGELAPIVWSINWKNGLPLLMIGWPVLLLWRTRRSGWDLVELLLCTALTAQALSSQRFVSFYALVAAPYVARDFSEFLATRQRSPLAMPVGVRAGFVALVIPLLVWLECSTPALPVRIGIDDRQHPIAACDFIEREGIRGRTFNHFWYGGYMAYRFWPDESRLPFMTGHLESVTRQDRELYVRAQAVTDPWEMIQRVHQFDLVVLSSRVSPGPLREAFDADPSWSAVFMDDAAVVYVRHTPEFLPIIERNRYRVVPGSATGRARLLARIPRDASLRARAKRELEREVGASPYHANAASLLAAIEILDGAQVAARARLEEVLAVDPLFPRANERIGLIDLSEGKLDDAMRRFQTEYRTLRWPTGFDLRMGMVYQHRGDLEKAMAAYRRALSRNPSDREASDSLASVRNALGR